MEAKIIHIGPIVDQLQDLVHQIQDGDYSTPDEAVLITSDKDTGLLTINCLTEKGVDVKHKLFHRMAIALDYAKVN